MLEEYNAHTTVTPAIDAKFASLAQQRVRSHPILCLVWVPVLRVADMALRPRTETLSLDADWWRFDEHHVESIEGVALGLLNLALVVAALWGVARRRMPWVAMAVVYVLLRYALLSTMENSEPRYTLEVLPILIACAACAFESGSQRKVRPSKAWTGPMLPGPNSLRG